MFRFLRKIHGSYKFNLIIKEDFGGHAWHSFYSKGSIACEARDK